MARFAACCFPVALLAGCDGVRRLDEALVYETDAFTLKVVRFHERVFLHYDGEIHAVMCRDPGTADEAAMDTQDAGWRTLGRGGAIGTNHASDLLEPVKAQYQPTATGGLNVHGTVLRLSAAGCGPFVTWDPTRQEGLEIDAVAKPDHCAPVGGGDCRYYDFFGERQPVYGNIRLTNEEIRFEARSPAFAAGPAIEVWSADRGRSWQWRPI